MIVVIDFNKIPANLRWSAVLSGNIVTTMASLKNEQGGAMLKYQRAISSSRLVFVTDEFKKNIQQFGNLWRRQHRSWIASGHSLIWMALCTGRLGHTNIGQNVWAWGVKPMLIVSCSWDSNMYAMAPHS